MAPISQRINRRFLQRLQMAARFVDMKLVATVCILMTILEPGESVKCYVSSDGKDGLSYEAEYLKTLKEMKRNGTYSLTIREDCKYCRYDLRVITHPAHSTFIRSRALEIFKCNNDDDYNGGQSCKNATWYSAADGTVLPKDLMSAADMKECKTDLCNTPCYEDATNGLPGHSPSASNFNGSNPSPNANLESTTTSGGTGLYNFGGILQLGCTTTIFAFTKWQM